LVISRYGIDIVYIRVICNYLFYFKSSKINTGSYYSKLCVRRGRNEEKKGKSKYSNKEKRKNYVEKSKVIKFSGVI